MATTMMIHRRTAPVRRLGTAADLKASRSALVVRQRYAALVVEGTSLEAGQANRRRMMRARRVRRLLRAVSMPLMLGIAVAGGLAVGRMGEGTRSVPTIAPTRQPVYHEVSTASLLPLALVPATRAAR